MTDQNILHDEEEKNTKDFKELYEPAKKVIHDFIKTSYNLEILEINIGSYVSSIQTKIKESLRILRTKNVPVYSIEKLKKYKSEITDKIFNTGIILTELNSIDNYDEVFREVNKKDGE